MSKEIVFEITLDGKSIYHFNTLTLNQAFNAHHTFELDLDLSVIDTLGTNDMHQAQNYVGKRFSIGFGEKEPTETFFKGIVTEIGLSQKEGAWGHLLLRGFSLSYLLEAGAHYTSFNEVSMKQIFQDTIDNTTQEEFPFINEPVCTEKFDYVCQYGESSFAFMNRLSSQYGEWFYYDGRGLRLGRPSKIENIDLIYGSNISSMEFAMKVIPMNIDTYSYDANEDNLIEANVQDSDTGQTTNYTRKVMDVSSDLYRLPVKQPVDILMGKGSNINSHSQMLKAKAAASSIVLAGSGDCPKLLLGGQITIKVPIKTSKNKDNEDQGEFIVTKIKHKLTGAGGYENTFEGTPSINKVIPFYGAVKPIAQTQQALVSDNDDPKGAGRVRVQMLWQQGTDQKTDWIRVMTPDAGSSSEVSKNRGQVFIPEVGDQVLVSFRYNDPNRPFVMGSLFHGKIAAGGKDANSIKSIQTRSGHLLEFNDTDSGESITIKDKNGNMIFLDTAGKNLTITAPETMTFNAKNMVMKVEENITISAGKDMKTDIDGEMQTSVGKNHTLTISEKHQISSKETNESVDDDKTVEIKGDLKLTTAEISMTASKGDVLIKSSGTATMAGKKDAKVSKG